MTGLFKKQATNALLNKVLKAPQISVAKAALNKASDKKSIKKVFPGALISPLTKTSSLGPGEMRISNIQFGDDPSDKAKYPQGEIISKIKVAGKRKSRKHKKSKKSHTKKSKLHKRKSHKNGKRKGNKKRTMRKH